MATELIGEIAKVPIKIGLAQALNANLFFINELAQLAKINVFVVFRNRFGLGDIEAIDIVGKDSTYDRFCNGGVGVAPPEVVVVLRGVVEETLKVGRVPLVMSTGRVVGWFVVWVEW